LLHVGIIGGHAVSIAFVVVVVVVIVVLLFGGRTPGRSLLCLQLPLMNFRLFGLQSLA
jgi:hypothetical protein